MISFERNGRNVKLHEFSNEDVVKYLRSELTEFKVIAIPRLGNVVLVAYKDVCFGIYAKATCIELSYNPKEKEKMLKLIDVIKKWDKFSQTELTFYVQFEDEETYHTIFENGYATSREYERTLQNVNLKITEF